MELNDYLRGLLKDRPLCHPRNVLNRRSLGLLRRKKNLVGIEIGVSCGENAFDMLMKLDIDTLYLIDPYKEFRHWTQEKLDGHKQQARTLLNYFNNKIIWLEQRSQDAVKEISDNELDFVYIDGSHDFKDVLSDIELYWPKVKKTGLVCGDNFEYGPVRSAIETFAKTVTEKFSIDNNYDVKSIDWWFIKQ